MAARRAGLRALVASPATTLAERRDGVRASTMPSGRRHRSAQLTAVNLLEVSSQMFARPSTLRVSDVVIRAGIVGLALATGYIHSTLGGLLFTLNAVGYVVAAIAMVIPLALAVRFRWVIRLGLMGYAATTIIGWAIQGPYYSTAYLAKGIEVALIVLVAIDFARMDGNPVTLIRRELASFAALVTSRRQAGAAA
jgi:hypothetical protein